jgi:hypothetical protein
MTSKERKERAISKIRSMVKEGGFRINPSKVSPETLQTVSQERANEFAGKQAKREIERREGVVRGKGPDPKKPYYDNTSLTIPKRQSRKSK